MKNIFLFIIASMFISCLARAEAPDTTKIPEKWKKESLIILKYSYQQTLSVYGKGSQTVRIVYYLRDKWALDEVSQINMPFNVKGEFEDGAVGKVYKRNKQEILIDTAHLIPQKTTVDINNSAKNKSILSIESLNGRKLAVPSVEVGDILEIWYTTENNKAPEMIPLVNKFCMMNYSIDINISHSGGFTYGNPYAVTTTYSLNPRIMNSSVNFRSNLERAFTIEMDTVEKYKEEILNDNLTLVPYVLIGISSSNIIKDEFEYTKLSGDELVKKQTAHVLSIYYKGDNAEKSLANAISSKLKSKHLKITDTLQFINDAYYYYREAVAGEYAYMGYTKSGYKGDYFFVNVMGRIFTARDVKYKTFLSQESHYGGVNKSKDMLAPVYGITFPGKNKHLFNPLYNLEPNNMPSYFENQNYIAFDASKHYKKANFSWYPVLLTAVGARIYYAVAQSNLRQNSNNYIDPNTYNYTPAYYDKQQSNLRNAVLLGASGLVFSTVIYIGQNAGSKKKRKFGYEEKSFQYFPPQNNSIKNEIVVENIIPVANKVKVNSINKFYGKMRIDELRKLTDYTNIYYEKENEYTKKTTPAAYAKQQTSEEKEKEVKRMNKVFKNELEDDNFEVDEVKNYSIQQADFFNTDTPVEYTIGFTAKNMVTETGNYLIVQAGKLIGSQLRVGEENADRTQDFYIPFQKQFEKSIKIKIPAGYTIQNLEEFNVSRQTSAGKFVTTASISGEYFVLNSVKTYAFQYYEREDVDDIYSFLKLAQEFENKRLILKK